MRIPSSFRNRPGMVNWQSSSPSLHLRRRMGPAWVVAIFVWIFFLGCHGSPRPDLPLRPEAVSEREILENLFSQQGSLRGLKGVADLKLSLPDYLYRGKTVFLVGLPDQIRIELMNFVGFPDLILSSDGQMMEVSLPSEGKTIRGTPTPEEVERLCGVRIPLPQLLRILLGHPPYSLDEEVATWVLAGSGGEFRGPGKEPGLLAQRIRTDEAGRMMKGGEIVDQEGVWLSFQLGDYRKVGEFLIPFLVDIKMKRERMELQLAYREVEPNPSLDPAAFRLSRSGKERLPIFPFPEVTMRKDPGG